MSYDIRLIDPVTREAIEAEAPHLMQGGTYVQGGTAELWLNVTYNYGKHYRRVMGDDGIRTIYGMTGAESIPILENEYCGDGDVWGFVAYAIRDTVIERGTRIAQFMPAPFIPDWDAIKFEEDESMGCADRGGYGSTGVM